MKQLNLKPKIQNNKFINFILYLFIIPTVLMLFIYPIQKNLTEYSEKPYFKSFLQQGGVLGHIYMNDNIKK